MTQNSLRQWLKRLDDHSPGEASHGERVAVYAVSTAERLEASDEFLTEIRFAAALHDVGKLSLHEELVRKQGRLAGREVIELRTHAELGPPLLADELSAQGLAWIRSHHERWDGNGYPEGAATDNSPLGARIIAVAETFDVLVHDNRWRPKIDEDAAIEEIRRCAGTQFDPEIVEAFLTVQPLIQPLK